MNSHQLSLKLGFLNYWAADDKGKDGNHSQNQFSGFLDLTTDNSKKNLHRFLTHNITFFTMWTCVKVKFRMVKIENKDKKTFKCRNLRTKQVVFLKIKYWKQN